MSFDSKACTEYIEKEWDATVVPTLVDYVKIPNLSPHFDKEWATNGLLEKAAELLVDWVKAQKVEGLTLETVVLEGRTPLIFMEVEATAKDAGTILMYGHYDKQPPFEGWDEGLGPYTPVIKDDKLYGRGAADDGYSIFTAVTSIQALKLQNVPHGRIVVIVEGCEESGSPDLMHYVEHLKPRIGTPDLIVCLDSGAGDYKRMWVTTSLRGIVIGELAVDILKEGVHSGDASGVVPDSFRIARKVLSKVECQDTGKILIDDLYVEIPKERVEQTKEGAKVLGDEIFSKFPFVDGAQHTTAESLSELSLNRAWRPQLAVTGAGGLPDLANAGNVLRPNTKLKLSFRIPPNLEPKKAGEAVKNAIEKDPPYGAKVQFDLQGAATGWEAPPVAPWLSAAADKASTSFYGSPTCYQGEGGSIPFMGMLGEMFPSAQFLIIGVLGPQSNAHGPNEFFHIPFAKKLTGCVASVVADHANHK